MFTVILGITIVAGSTAGYSWLFRDLERQGRPVGRRQLFVLGRPFLWVGLALIATAFGVAAFALCFSIAVALAVAGALGHSLGVPPSSWGRPRDPSRARSH
jgi:hypothetical protein